MNEVMNQYELLAPFQNQDAGFSRWTYACKKNKYYFLKEFLDPIYPTDDSLSLNLRQQRIRDCQEFESKQIKLYQAINNASQGNLVRIEEFFRYDNHYYIATERIDGLKLSMEEIQTLPYEDRFLLCKTIAYEIMNLHRAHIVHADIKDANIIIKKTKKGKFVGKIVDFDAGFFEDDPPQYEDELNGDQIYLAPEACQYICGDSVKLTCKIDVFALGILFHQYLAGEIPGFNTEEYDYAFDAVLDDQKLEVDSKLKPELQSMIKGMLDCNPDRRLSMEMVYLIMQSLDPDPDQESETSVEQPEDTNSKSSEDWFFSPGDL